jgi:hypothetical protein
MGHPVVKGKTLAWCRATVLSKFNSLIVEELQSDILNEKVLNDILRFPKVYFSSNLALHKEKEHVTVTDLKLARKTLEKLMGMWEVSALDAVKKYAFNNGIDNIYMIPGHVKAKKTDRADADGDFDIALERIYDKIPPMVGFTKLSIEEIKVPSIVAGLKQVSGKYIWYTKSDKLRVGNTFVRVANLLRRLRLLLQ